MFLKQKMACFVYVHCSTHTLSSWQPSQSASFSCMKILISRVWRLFKGPSDLILVVYCLNNFLNLSSTSGVTRIVACFKHFLTSLVETNLLKVIKGRWQRGKILYQYASWPSALSTVFFFFWTHPLTFSKIMSTLVINYNIIEGGLGMWQHTMAAAVTMQHTNAQISQWSCLSAYGVVKPPYHGIRWQKYERPLAVWNITVNSLPHVVLYYLAHMLTRVVNYWLAAFSHHVQNILQGRKW